MSEPETQAPENHPQDTAPTKKRQPGFKQKMALLEVIERKRLSHRVDYKAVAARTGVPENSLRQLWSQWDRGMIDLGEPETPQEREIDARMQHEKTLGLLKRYQALILVGFESSLLTAEDEVTRGVANAAAKNGLPSQLRELKAIIEMRGITEKGYNAILEEEMSRRRGEKPLLDSPRHDVETKVISATEEQRAIAALEA